tara:strand:+ start:57558 stop:57902 length:345 start_codon:yes stop_codon:yes gene_type:complete
MSTNKGDKLKKLSETLIELGIDFTFPIKIKNANGNETYHEDGSGFWFKCEYNANGNETYFENGNGFWVKREYDANGNETYFEDSDGVKRGQTRSQSCAGKVIEVDGKKYRLEEV